MFGLKEYFNEFVDKTLNERWGLAELDDNQIRVQLPNGLSVVGGADRWDWGQSFPRDEATSRLWYQSLLWLPFLSSDLGRDDLVINVLEDYISWLKDRALKPGYRPFNSQDHAHAVQIRSACAIIARASADELQDSSIQIRTAATAFLRSLEPVVFQDQYMLPNNHGLMLARAFLEAGFVLRMLGGQEKLAEKYIENGRAGTSFVIDHVFNDEGVVNENTPAYQGLYIDIISAIARFQRRVDGTDPRIQQWENLLEMATSNLELMLWSDGRYPPLGDDTGERAKFSPRTGTLFSKENGCYFYSDEETELSIICGYRGIVHKHADDTSVRLRFKGKDLVMDAGLLSYDLKDPVAVSLFSQRGHSGLFYRRFDTLRGQELYFTRPPRAVSQIDKMVLDNGQTVIHCRSTIDDEWKVERRYSQSDRQLLIDDRYECPEGEEPPIQRFLLHEDALVTLKDSVVTIQHGDALLEICADPSASIKIMTGSSDESIHGWRAAARYEPVPCHVVEIEFPRDSKNLRTSLVWSEKRDGENPSDLLDLLELEKVVSVGFEGKNFVFPESMSAHGFVVASGRLTPRYRISLSSASALLKELDRLSLSVGSWILDLSQQQGANGFLLVEENRDVVLTYRNRGDESRLASLLRLNEASDFTPQPLLMPEDATEGQKFDWLDDSRPGLVLLDRDVTEVAKLTSIFSSFVNRPAILFFGSLREQVRLTTALGGEGEYVPYISYSDGGLILLPNVDPWDHAVRAVLGARRSANGEIAIRDLRYRNALLQDQISELQLLKERELGER